MEDPALAAALEKSLAMLDTGEDLDTVVARFPEFAAELTPLLETAQKLQATAPDAVEVPVDFLRDLGDQLRARA